MGHDIIKQYSCIDFLSIILKIFEEIDCILCGQIHPIRVHQYFIRYVRSEVNENNISIIIFSVFCQNAKAAGKQYTKRILPYFVIPECNICLVNVIRFYQICLIEGIIQYPIANNIPGTVCESTIKRHYDMATEYISQTILMITCFIATIPNLTDLDSFLPAERNDLEKLTHQAAQINQAVKKAGIPVSSDINPIRMIHRTYVLQKCRKPVNLPMHLVICSILFYDTS